MRLWARSPRAWTAAAAACALAAALVAGIARHVLFDLVPEDHVRSVTRFSAGIGETVVEPRTPWARLPWILPGPADAWAGGTEHALTLPLGRLPLHALVLFIDDDDPRTLQAPAPLVRREAVALGVPPAAMTRLEVLVSGTPVTALDPRARTGRPAARGDPATPRRHRVEIPAHALGDGS